MTADEFNEKYKNYIIGSHYGLDIDIPSVVDYLDKEFQEFIKVPGFKYSQIKLKFHTARFYCEPKEIDSCSVEDNINNLIKIYDEQNKTK